VESPRPDEALWFTGQLSNSIGRMTIPTPYVSISPSIGSEGISVSVSGVGFTPGDRVTFTYKTGLAKPKKVVICSGVTQSDGTATCQGDIPAGAGAGAAGLHAVLAMSGSSQKRTTSYFTLT